MFTVQKRAELDEKGYVVIEDVLPDDVCDACIQQYQEWLSSFTKHNSWPFSYNSLIQRYKVGHAEPSWRVRLAAVPVFAQLWETEKLLTSFDAIAIGRPPEEGSEEFQQGNQHWLHSDQSASQIGRHCVQGAVYLESADDDDWTLEVLEESHKYHQEFMQSHPKAFLRSSLAKFYRLRDEEPEWFEEKGCLRKRVAVPKGGMVLWDSRLIHANAKPVKGRQNSGRWRHAVFVCMGPAIWASDEDLREKSLAYHQVRMTTHSPCQAIGLMPESIPSYCMKAAAVSKLPALATSEDAKRLSGVLKYNFTDGLPNGPDWTPVWRGGYKPGYSPTSKSLLNYTGCMCSFLVVLIGLLAYLFL